MSVERISTQLPHNNQACWKNITGTFGGSLTVHQISNPESRLQIRHFLNKFCGAETTRRLTFGWSHNEVSAPASGGDS
jgi:hypothetical protein